MSAAVQQQPAQDFPFAIGYGTNGWADHPLPVAVRLLAEQGYTAVALTLGHPHLDPFAPDVQNQVAEIRSLLGKHQMRVVIETGTRFLLDARHKHRPALVEEHAEVRLEFLRRAIDIAAALDAECVSFFSGILPEGTSAQLGWQRLIARVGQLVDYAASNGVLLSIEPEPGMLVETVADALRLRTELGNPQGLRVTVDIGHCVVVEPHGVEAALRQAGELLANVQLDDMMAHAHEHLPFGQGIVDLSAALNTLADMDYRGIAAVELPRHSWDAPALALDSMAALREAWAASEAQRRTEAWLRECLSAVAENASGLPRIFASAGRRVGRAPNSPQDDPAGVLYGTADDTARARLIRELSRIHEPGQFAQEIRDLYYRGDSAERRGVLRGINLLAQSMPELDGRIIATGLELTSDALRTNETSLVAAAVGPFAASHLDQHAWRHAVLKLIFMGVSLSAVSDLSIRADAELARMAEDFAAERRAAHRPVPTDVGLLQDLASHTSRP